MDKFQYLNYIDRSMGENDFKDRSNILSESYQSLVNGDQKRVCFRMNVMHNRRRRCPICSSSRRRTF